MADEPTKGYGQQDPADSVGGFNPISFAIKQALARVSTNKIVKVLAVDTAKHTVDVQIAVNQLDGQLNSTPHGTIAGIPYIWAMGGTNAFMFDPVVGDIGLMCVCDRDISTVKNTQAIANPGSSRKFSPSDGVYLCSVPGLNGTAPTQWVKWTEDGIQIQAAHGNLLTSDAQGWHVTGAFTVNGAAKIAGDLNLAGGIKSDTGGLYSLDFHTSGTVIADTDVLGAGTRLHTHAHTGVTTGGGTSGPPAP